MEQLKDVDGWSDRYSKVKEKTMTAKHEKKEFYKNLYRTCSDQCGAIFIVLVVICLYF